MKRIDCNIAVSLIFLMITSFVHAQDTYYSQGTGDWGDIAWNTERDGTGITTIIPGSGNNVVIQNGDTVILPLSPNYEVNNLTVEEGGVLYSNRSNKNNVFLKIYGTDVIINGQIGNGDIFDVIGLEFLSTECTISGLGEIDLSRIRKPEFVGDSVTTLTIDTDLNLRYGNSDNLINQRTVLYNEFAETVFNVIINEGVTVKAVGNEFGPSSISIDGPDGTNSTSGGINRMGSITINGTLEVSGDVFVTTDNNNSTDITYTVNGTLSVGGKIYGNDKKVDPDGEISGTDVPGDSDAKLVVNSTGTLELTGGGAVITNIDGIRDDFQFDENAQIIFNSTEAQEIYSGFTYPSITVDGGGIKTISTDNTELEITHELIFTDALIQTGTVPVYVSNTEREAIQGMDADSYIQGTLKRAVVSGFSYHFPVGDATDGYSSMDIDVTETGVNTDIAVSYTNYVDTEMDDTVSCDIDGQGPTALNYDCATGKWIVDAEEFGYEMTLNPSEATINRCASYENPTIRKDGTTYCNTGIEDVPFNSFSEFNIATASSFSILPVDLVSFDATYEDEGYVEITWVTASELNNSHFELERSVDGVHFEVIASVPGSGTTDEPQYYVYRDTDTFQGRYYYRMRQVDFDGSYEYFHTVEVFVEGTASINVLAAYPNPVEDAYHMEITLPGEQPATMIVYNMQGNEVWGGRITSGRVGYHAFELDASSWEAGVYVYRLSTGDNQIQGKIIKK